MTQLTDMILLDPRYFGIIILGAPLKIAEMSVVSPVTMGFSRRSKLAVIL